MDALAGLPVTWVPALVGGLVGLLGGILSDRWLRRRAYRYPDEHDLRTRSTTWLVVAMPLACGFVASGWWPVQPAFAVLAVAYCVVLGVLSAIDVDVRRLPDAITLPLVPITLVAVVAVAVVAGSADPLVGAVLGALALGAFYFIQVLLAGGRGMGLGDAKLAVSLGAVLGLQSWTHLILATTVTYLAALGYGLFLVVFRGGNRRTQLAFGPYMALGAVLVLAAPGLAGLLP